MEKFLGINIEHQPTNRLALTVMVVGSRLYHRLTGLEVEGQLPTVGSVLLVANHTSSTDILKMCYVCVSTSQRIIRGVTRKNLLYPSYKEPEEILKRTEKKDRFDPMKLPLVAPTIAFVLNGIGAISVRRGETDREFLRSCDSVLNSGQMLGIFAQETRVKEGDLRNIMPGIGFLARRHAGIPIVPIGISEHFVRIGQSFTYVNLEQSLNRKLDSRETTVEIVDRIARLLPEHVRTRWELTDRPLFLSRH